MWKQLFLFRYNLLLTDAYSKKITGHDISDSLNVNGSLYAHKECIISVK